MREFGRDWKRTVEDLHIKIDADLETIEAEVEEIAQKIHRCVEVIIFSYSMKPYGSCQGVWNRHVLMALQLIFC